MGLRRELFPKKLTRTRFADDIDRAASFFNLNGRAASARIGRNPRSYVQAIGKVQVNVADLHVNPRFRAAAH